MNLHMLALPTFTVTRLKFKKAVLYLKRGQRDVHLHDDVHKMLRILYDSEGQPRLGFFEHAGHPIEALIFDAKTNSEKNYEYPVMLRDNRGDCLVYSLMRRPNKPPLLYYVENFTITDSWVGKHL